MPPTYVIDSEPETETVTHVRNERSRSVEDLGCDDRQGVQRLKLYSDR